MGDYSFNPQAVYVSAGDTVNWTNEAGTPQTTTSDPMQAESWDSGSLNPGQSFVHTFTIPGTYTYTSTLDSNMYGEVVVQEPVPEFPGILAFAAVSLAVGVGLVLERGLRR
jgi:plastocyanin